MHLGFVQVAVLSFGDFYDPQFVKLYTIFMVQLQVETYLAQGQFFVNYCWYLKMEISNMSMCMIVYNSEYVVFMSCFYRLFFRQVLMCQSHTEVVQMRIRSFYLSASIITPYLVLLSLFDMSFKHNS